MRRSELVFILIAVAVLVVAVVTLNVPSMLGAVVGIAVERRLPGGSRLAWLLLGLAALGLLSSPVALEILKHVYL